MGMKTSKKAKSKRLSCSKKYKIQRKVREHHRKLRKALKGKEHRPKKDPGIPTSMPFSEEVIKENMEMRNRDLAEKEKRRKLLKDLKQAAKRAEKFEKKSNAAEAASESKFTVSPAQKIVESSKAFFKEFSKVLSSANVIIEVLDSRDPNGSRCPEVEEEVLKAGKRLVLVLNKIDLVPREIVLGWLAVLREQHPTIAFKANTSKQRSGPRARFDTDIPQVGSKCLGLDTLLKLLKGYAAKMGSVVAGVIGLPNTGKSSLINSLSRSRGCEVGPVPGVTRHAQEIAIDKQVRMMDCPGVVLSRGGDPADLVLKNCVRVEAVADPELAAIAVLRRCSRPTLRIKYSLPADALSGDDQQFLLALARRFGRVKKGGVPDTRRAARLLIEDWVRGNITYYTQPPQPEERIRTAEETKVLSDLAPSFLDELNAKVLARVEKDKSLSDLVICSSEPAKLWSRKDEEALMETEDNDEEEEEEEDEDDEEEEEMDEETDSVDELDDDGATRLEENPASDNENEDNGKRSAKSWKQKGKDQAEEVDYLRGLRRNRELRKQQAKLAKKKRKLAAKGLN